MAKDFNNEELRDLLRDMKDLKTDDSVKKAMDALFSTSLLIPAVWDKEPTIEENGRMAFAPNTKFNLALAKNKKEQKFVVMFTSNYDYKRWDATQRFKPMVVSFNQIMSMIENMPGLEGILIDPLDENLPIGLNFLKQIKVHKGVSLQKTQMKKGDKITVRNVNGNERLKQAFIQYGVTHKNIQAIYLKERVYENEQTTWFIIVDAKPEDPSVFQDLAKFTQKYQLNKPIEFIFASHKISQQIIENSQPLYVVSESEDVLS